MNVLAKLFGDIAAEIKDKLGDNTNMKPAEFPAKIKAIGSGGVDVYYQRLAEALMMRNAEYLSSDKTKMIMRGFKASDGNTLVSINPYSFAGFTDVECMTFSDVLFVQNNAFAGNSKLKILDITVSQTHPMFGVIAGGFNGCTALEALIVRGGDVAVTSATVLATHGGNDTFYVYVPAADYDTIISNLSDVHLSKDRYRKLEDYPLINYWDKEFTVEFYDGENLVDTKTVKCGATATTNYTKDGWKLVGWNPAPVNVCENMKVYGEWEPAALKDLSWANVVSMAQSGKLMDLYPVGSEKDLTLNYADGTSETVTAVLANGNCKMKTTGNTFTTANAVFMLKNPVMKAKYKMASGISSQFKTYSGGVYTALTTTILDAIPAELASAIIPRSHSKFGNIDIKLWCPVKKEVNYTETVTADLGDIDLHGIFPDQASRILKQYGTDIPVEWWTCDYYSSSNFYYYYWVHNDGSISYKNNGSTTQYNTYIAFGFCI